jgi:hypothetical protein
MTCSRPCHPAFSYIDGTDLIHLPDDIHVIRKDSGVLEFDGMLPIEAVPCHFQLIWLFKRDVSAVFLHSGLN